MRSMINRIAVRAPILAAAAWLCATPSLANVKAGVEAWSRGDYDAAIREWDKDAARGDADAQFNLAQAYKLGRGVPQDLAKAETLFGKAAAQGHIQAADNCALLRFQRGDRVGALPHLEAAADRGDARAQYVLGIAHFNGDIVAKDWVRAYALLTLARQAGLSQANSALTQMDAYIDTEQRQKAAALAPRMADQAQATRARQLAAVDLAVGAPATMQRTAGADFARPKPELKPAAGPSASKVAAKPANRPATSTPPSSGLWRVQLGAFGVRSNADALWNKVKGRPELSGHARIDVASASLTRLQAGGFSRAAAKSACSRLSAAGFACLVTRN